MGRRVGGEAGGSSGACVEVVLSGPPSVAGVVTEAGLRERSSDCGATRAATAEGKAGATRRGPRVGTMPRFTATLPLLRRVDA